ncbi:hypothetical protein [Desulfospira joergensenii]|uniref:hypothetical protein n=1 Tax=Desulfospira joergensenii TaxID=53329 RepID=UPI0004250C44|nr:hypothetical protein [Desulfospira joergensenii]
MHGKHLVSVRELIQNKDFKGAARENERILELYRGESNKPDQDDPVLAQYMRDAMILSHLLNRIIEDEKKIEDLYINDLINRDQLKVRTRMIQSLKKNLARLKKELAETKALNERIKALENENSNLLEQIDRLKAIDLDPA